VSPEGGGFLEGGPKGGKQSCRKRLCTFASSEMGRYPRGRGEKKSGAKDRGEVPARRNKSSNRLKKKRIPFVKGKRDAKGEVMTVWECAKPDGGKRGGESDRSGRGFRWGTYKGGGVDNEGEGYTTLTFFFRIGLGFRGNSVLKSKKSQFAGRRVGSPRNSRLRGGKTRRGRGVERKNIRAAGCPGQPISSIVKGLVKLCREKKGGF